MENKVYTYEEVLSASTEYFHGDDLAAKAFVDKYALRNKEGNFIERTPDDMHHRMARELARIEKKKYTGTAMEPLTEKEIYELFKEFKYIVPQGSVMSGLGDNVNYTSLSNCFVVNSPEDSYAGICKTDEELVQISKRRGGTGCSLDNLRPSGTPTTNSAKTSTGVVTFMERYSNTIREVGQNSRRGALLITLSIHHPDVLAFINAKKDLSKVTGANISVQLSDEFMNAVQSDTDYEQRWPINSKHPKIIKKVQAKDIWNQIVANAHATAEPGVFFWDTALKESPADCYSAFGFKTITANPCGEVPLSILDSCRLLALNLVSYVKNPYSDSASFDWSLFKQYAIIAQRLMDDIVDAECERVDRIIKKIHSDPENESLKERELSLWKNVREVCESGRRTGTGTTAVGDMVAALNMKYDSDASISHIENVFRTLKLACYRSSIDMAKAIGPFKYYDAKLEEHNSFIKRIAIEDPELYADMKKHGRRNIAMLTNAPTGTVSLMTQTTSGIEPLFMMSYTRRKKINDGDRSVKVDFVDPKGDKWQEFEVFHPQIEKWKIAAMSNDITKSPWYGGCAEDIAWDKRVKLQAACQKHIDHAISSTVNVPEDTSVSTIQKIYMLAWELGCKGITVYRKNSRTGVLVEKKQTLETIKKNHAPKRPKELPCDVHHVHIKGTDYYVLVGLLHDDPYEVFAGKETSKIEDCSEGTLTKLARGAYKLTSNNKTIIEDVTHKLHSDEEALTRMTSTALRHGADIAFVVHQLEKTEGDMMSFAKSIARALKKYLKDGAKVSGESCLSCGNEELHRQEGCVTCKNCGWSKCV